MKDVFFVSTVSPNKCKCLSRRCYEISDNGFECRKWKKLAARQSGGKKIVYIVSKYLPGVGFIWKPKHERMGTFLSHKLPRFPFNGGYVAHRSARFSSMYYTRIYYNTSGRPDILMMVCLNL